MTAKENIDILVLEGDGIGPEITAATLAVLRAADAKFGLGLAFKTAVVGWAAHKAAGTTFPDSVEALAKDADGVLLGPVSHNDYPPRAQGGLNPSGEMRKRLALYANIRPARSREGFPRVAARRLISSSCERTPKVFTPTETCFRAPANSCRRRISRSPCAK